MRIGSLTSAMIAATGPAAEPASTADRAVLLFIVVAGLLTLFLLIVILLTISNRRHAEKDGKPTPTSSADAWRIAGERAQPLDSPPSRNADDRTT
jgi:hypothetical protein